MRSCGREAEGGGLLNRYTTLKSYRGFESLRLRHLSLIYVDKIHITFLVGVVRLTDAAKLNS